MEASFWSQAFSRSACEVLPVLVKLQEMAGDRKNDVQFIGVRRSQLFSGNGLLPQNRGIRFLR